MKELTMIYLVVLSMIVACDSNKEDPVKVNPGNVVIDYVDYDEESNCDTTFDNLDARELELKAKEMYEKTVQEDIKARTGNIGQFMWNDPDLNKVRRCR